MSYNYNQGGGYPSQAGPGGFQAPPAGPPPGADPQLWQMFSAVDVDRSGAISAKELQQALINGDWTPFDLDTVRLLMTIFDTDRSGTVGFNEFAGLWQYIKDWQGYALSDLRILTRFQYQLISVFRHFDADRSGSIDGQELANALQQFGYNLSPQLLDLISRKYEPKATTTAGQSAGGFRASGQSTGVTFDRFVRCCVVVKTLTESFQRLDTDRDGWVQINYDQFMHTVLSAP
ncbi:EF-hand [Sistotremastrum niveocremeum HHB9708]|uniref:EF-hand n=1 Tax=Sistotremastrum niveocremeum HHB9708 TaxID=1314777 RepID=A0A164MTE8_9AGAM|nr:EF-hand [Sistotremastrum niveocremeum HHB9708]